MTNFLVGIIVGMFSTILVAGFALKYKEQPITLIKSTTDNRGLTSVVYKQGKDTLALDYLTVSELDSLVSIGR